MTTVLGIHHITAIASDPQRNLDFYSGTLGLRCVKRTVNFDDPQTYHLYYGDETGHPGTLLTFFPWPHAQAGRQGTGQVAVTSFAILPAALGFWVERLVQHGVKFEGPTRRGSAEDGFEQVLAFKDHDGLMLELVAHAGAHDRGPPVRRRKMGSRHHNANHGLFSATIWAVLADATEKYLSPWTLGFREVSEAGATKRFAAGDGGPGTLVDLRTIGGFLKGTEGAGTVHHIAWRVTDDEAQLALRERVLDVPLHATPVIDRTYFHSVYFREPGGVRCSRSRRIHRGLRSTSPWSISASTSCFPHQLELHRAEIVADLPADAAGGGLEREDEPQPVADAGRGDGARGGRRVGRGRIGRALRAATRSRRKLLAIPIAARGSTTVSGVVAPRDSSTSAPPLPRYRSRCD